MDRKNKGFTLLEVLISLAIIIFIMFAFFKIYNSSIRVNTKNDRDIKALNLAQNELENLRNQIKTLGDKTYLNVGEDKVEINQINEISDKIDISDINEKTKNYKKNYNDDEMKPRKYDIKLNLYKENIVDKMYLFHIYVLVESEDKHFTKRKVELSTSILSKNNNDIDTEQKPNPPTENKPDPDFINGISYIYFNGSSSSLHVGNDINTTNNRILNTKNNESSVNLSEKTTFKISFKPGVNNNKIYLNSVVNDKEYFFDNNNDTLFREYYKPSYIKIESRIGDESRNSLIRDIKINGELVKHELNKEERYFEFYIGESEEVNIEFDVIKQLNNYGGEYFRVSFGKSKNN
ncbi:prepilin-type N-terminal cleavage/methylation domain-containing protein [Clostridium sp. CCUG 7971]|uniref:prepilin-type N-terminal cleavage/methylation domain-containing protein n=1 Tax=Clostridium sp. CCUG 7971 TaxID=2811414 RepID=UPI001ABB5E5B|nr:prepilin-type N-terminal cleavage/methylation domain-containing protein [Clostridium sp. CCUG 7971]MBO3444075.1 prepilin-type N-terminal cleavage/methylation domain-containing protein [Clostridium sp. CCUG 7971]